MITKLLYQDLHAVSEPYYIKVEWAGLDWTGLNWTELRSVRYGLGLK